MTRPFSPARALYEILEAVNSKIGHDEQHAYGAWQAVSGQDIGTSTFVEYHAEVVELLSETVEALGTLPASAEARYARYVPDWWSALVRPRSDWAQVNAEIIEPAPLHMLGALADVLDEKAKFAGPRNLSTPEVLTQAILFLLDQVSSAPDLPETVREQITADLNHIYWLLQHVDVFGVDHAVAATEKAAGKILSQATKTPSKTLKTVAVGLVAALSVTATATTSLDSILTNVKHTFGITADTPEADEHADVVQSTVVKIYEQCATPKLLPVGSADASTTDEGGEDLLEGEIVEELPAGRR